MSKHRYSTEHIRRSLRAYVGTDAFIAENLQRLFALPVEDQRPLLDAVAQFANAVPQAGAVVAFEIVARAILAVRRRAV